MVSEQGEGYIGFIMLFVFFEKKKCFSGNKKVRKKFNAAARYCT